MRRRCMHGVRAARKWEGRTMRSRTNDATCARSVAWIGSYVSHVRNLCPGEGEGTSAVSGWAIVHCLYCGAPCSWFRARCVKPGRARANGRQPPTPPPHTRGGGGHCMGAQALTIREIGYSSPEMSRWAANRAEIG